MIPIETLIVFIGAATALSLAPGPDNIFVLTQSALSGRKAGIFVTLGLCTGLLVHTAAVALGVAVIFQTSAIAFTILKIIGAIYLLYLAAQALRSSTSRIKQTKQSDQLSVSKLYRRGIIMNLTNPKVAIFFLAFLPQFADPKTGSISLQLIVLGITFILVALVVFSVIAWCAGFLGEWLNRSDKAQVIMNRIAATVFAALAIRLIFSER